MLRGRLRRRLADADHELCLLHNKLAIQVHMRTRGGPPVPASPAGDLVERPEASTGAAKKFSWFCNSQTHLDHLQVVTVCIMIQAESLPPTTVASSQSTIAAVPEPTRLFVSGLPPNFTSDQLAAHFGSQSKITDAYVLADRRIGFVGFSDPGAAQNAVRHFNKSYIRMSKIAVDLARPVEAGRDSTRNAVSTLQRTLKAEGDKANRKRKRLQDDDGEAVRADKSRDQPPQDQVEQASKPTTGREDEEAPESAQPATTDNDWLRGRTNRTLDLVHPDDVQIQQDDEPEVPEAVVSGIVKDDVGAALKQEEPQITRVPNARLFVRNLAFSVTDDDLLQQFKVFGKVQEVSSNFHPSSSHHRHDDFLIGTTYAIAYDVNGKEYFSRCFSPLISIHPLHTQRPLLSHWY